MTRRTRRTLAVGCIALVVLAAFIPSAASALGAAVLIQLGPLFPVLTVSIVRLDRPASCEQPLALLATAAFRAPPAV